MKNELTIVSASDFGIEDAKAQEITKGLDQIINERNILAEQYAKVIKLEITEENIQVFKSLRLQISKNRTQGINKWHKANKDFYLQGGKFVDAIKRKEIAENERMESNLMENEKHFENLEIQRLKELQQKRLELIMPFIDDAEYLDLSFMQEDVFEAYLSTKKKAYQDKIDEELRIKKEKEAAEKAEAERIEAQRIENEKLKREAEERERIQKEKDAKAEAERKAIQAEADKKIQAERKERERIQKELDLKAKLEAEEKARLDKIKAQEDAEAEKLAKAPIKQQLNIWVNCFEVPPLLIDNEISKEIIEKFEAFKKWSLTQVENL